MFGVVDCMWSILGSLELVLKCHKQVAMTLLVWRLAARDEPPGDKGN